MGTQNYSNNIYKYAGKKFLFSAYFYIIDNEGKEDGNYVTNDSIVMFQYENELNKLYLTAEMIVTDKYAVVDKYFDQLFSFCRIAHKELKGNRDGELYAEQFDPDNKFEHDFLIYNIKILDRKSHEITYKIDLVSKNWRNCIANVSYTNYDKKPEEIFDIIKSLMQQVDMEIVTETFDKIKSKVKINYITLSNDNLLTSVNYLLHKMYYYDDKTDSMKFILYNETCRKYQLFDVANMDLNNGTTNVIMSMFKSLTEIQVNTEPIQLGSIAKRNKGEAFKNIFDVKMYDYDINTNSFVDKSLEHKTLVDFKNVKPDDISKKYIGKFNNYKMKLNYNNSGTYWNNDFEFYSDCKSHLLEDGSLVLGTDPDILRKPGSFVSLNLDRDDFTMSGSEDVEALDKVKYKYHKFEGFWFVGKVRHIISPLKPMYRQNLVLFRNFVDNSLSCCCQG